MIEEWRDIEGYEGLYRISNYGNVWSVQRVERGRIFGGYMMQQRDRGERGYMAVYLSKKGTQKRFSVHRLVAQHFISNPYNYPIVNHKDENPRNNRVDNLEWCTQKHNCNYGTRIDRIKANMPQNKAIYQLSMNGDIIAEFKTIQEAARITGISAGHICSVCKGDREFANGFKWRYADEGLYRNAVVSLNEKLKNSQESRKNKFIEKSLRVSQYTLEGVLIRVFNGMR